MKIEKIESIVISSLDSYCKNNSIEAVIDRNTPLIGRDRIFDSLGLVNLIVDIETAFLDENIEISLTSEAAMSGRISPFRNVGSLCNYVSRQIESKENE